MTRHQRKTICQANKLLDEDDGSWHSEADLEGENSDGKLHANKCIPAAVPTGLEKEAENDAMTENMKYHMKEKEEDISKCQPHGRVSRLSSLSDNPALTPISEQMTRL